MFDNPCGKNFKPGDLVTWNDNDDIILLVSRDPHTIKEYFYVLFDTGKMGWLPAGHMKKIE